MSDQNNSDQIPQQIVKTQHLHKQDSERDEETQQANSTQLNQEQQLRKQQQKKENDFREKIKVLMHKAINQITKGCGRSVCFYPHCPARKDNDLPTTKVQVVKLALLLAKKQEFIECPPLINQSPPLLKAQLTQIQNSLSFDQNSDRLVSLFQNYQSLGMSFFFSQESSDLINNACIDIQGLCSFYEKYQSIDNKKVSLHDLIHNALQSLDLALKSDFARNYKYPIHMRAILIIILCKYIHEPNQQANLNYLLNLIQDFRAKNYQGHNQIFRKMLISIPTNIFKQLVGSIQTYLSLSIENGCISIPTEAIYFLDVLYDINMNQFNYLIPIHEFYNDYVSGIFKRSIKQQYKLWLQKDQLRELLEQQPDYILNQSRKQILKEFCIIDCPWIINPLEKSFLLLLESRVEQSHNIHSDLQSSDFGIGTLPFFYMKIKRNQIIQDALNFLTNTTMNLKKPLRVIIAKTKIFQLLD